MKFYQFLLCSLIVFSSCKNVKSQNIVFNSSNLKIEQLTENTFVHISLLNTKSAGKVACNGMVVVDKGEAIVYDTPTSNEVSLELINWISNEKKAKIIAVVPTHFHHDCLGGLKAFHDQKIPSYGQHQTISLAKQNNKEIPLHGFEKSLSLKIGDSQVINQFFGAGHTVDNVVAYYEKDQVLFGGCLVKALKVGKGNLADADVNAWPNSVKHIKDRFPKLKHVIPGHGLSGGLDLLDYTIDMFKN